MRQASGIALLRMAANARVHQVVGADELEAEETQAAWHAFADLMHDVTHNVPGLQEAGRTALERALDDVIAELRRLRVRVLAGGGNGVMLVAVVPAGSRRDIAAMFAGA
jgi:hypothetical protein